MEDNTWPFVILIRMRLNPIYLKTNTNYFFPFAPAKN